MPNDGPPGEAKAALAIALLLIAVAVVFDHGAIAWALGVPAFFLVAFAIARSPLRYALMGMMTCALTLENPVDVPAAGLYQSPMFSFGALMLAHMNNTTGRSWMFFSGMDLVLLVTGVVALQRRASRSKIDSRGRVRGPRVLRKLVYLSFAGCGVVLMWGMLRGGEFQKAFWQLDKLMYLPAVYLIAESSIRGSKDAIALGRVVVGAACYKALLAVYIKNFAEISKGHLDYAVSHHDSVLFALAVTILVSAIIHRARPNSLRVGLVLVPVLIAGMLANDRRMVWVQIGLVFTTLYFAMPMTPVKKKIRKWMLRLSPLMIVYATVGWFVPRGLFKPIATVQSIVQPAQDISTMLRDIENYDITQTFRAHPVLGTGFGIGYTEYIPLPPMPHPLEPYLPHNSLLGLWFACGFVGYTSITLLWTTGVFFGVRAYRFAKRRLDRATSLVCFGAVMMYLIQCYGDVGVGSWIAVFTVAPSLAMGGKLAIESGAWPEGNRARARPAPAEAAPQSPS